jgi:hypothetical protein
MEEKEEEVRGAGGPAVVAIGSAAEARRCGSTAIWTGSSGGWTGD